MKVFCPECDKSFASRFSMKRHQMTKHLPEDSEEEEMDEGSSNTEEEAESETEDETNSSGTSDSEETETDEDEDYRVLPEDVVFSDMIERAYATHKDEKMELKSGLVGNGLDDAEASERTHQELLPKYQKTLRNLFLEHLMKMQLVRKHTVYKSIMKKVRELEDEDFDRDEAIRAAVSHRKHLIFRMIPSDRESDSEND